MGCVLTFYKFWWARIKVLVKAKLNRFPLIKTPITNIWRAIKRSLLKCKWELLTLTNSYNQKVYCIDIDKTYWVSPKRIVYCSSRWFNIYNFRGRIIGGDWDRLKKKFEDLDIFIGLKQVLGKRKIWTETIFYQRILDRLSKGDVLYGCADKGAFDQRCKDFESLYQTVKDKGYKSQDELLRTREVAID